MVNDGQETAPIASLANRDTREFVLQPQSCDDVYVLDKEYDADGEASNIQLGSGGMCVVYLGHFRDTYKEIAIKMPHSRYAVTQYNSILSEGEMLCTLRHPHIVKGYGYGIFHEERSPGIAMERLQKTLGIPDAQEIEEKPIECAERDRILRIIAQIADALSYLHERNIVHRDIKPGNIMLDEGDQPRLLDFQLASSTPEYLEWGTPNCITPECARGGRVWKEADIFALGATAYQLLHGRSIYSAKKPGDIFEQARCHQKNPIDRAHIPPYIRHLLKAMLWHDPRQRPSISEVRVALQEHAETGA